MTEQSKSWRDVIKVHPAADLFPLMTPDEQKVMGEDIKKNGQAVPVTLWEPENTHPQTAWQVSLLDGRNRLDAIEAVGLPVLDKNGVWFDKSSHYKTVRGGDPYELVLSLNIHRRHLTPEQRREIIAKVLKAQPHKSNRTIAKQTKADHKTVGAVRDKLEARGEIPHVAIVEDTKGRKQPTSKKRRNVEDCIPTCGSGAGRVVTEGSGSKAEAVRFAVKQPKPDDTAASNRTEGLIDTAALSMSARAKLEAAIRQQKRELEAEFDKRVQDGVRDAIDVTVLPHYNETYATYRDVIATRRGIMDRASYRKIISCLHPDSRKSLSDEKLSEAFQLFGKVEKCLLDEKESPTKFMRLPKTYQELMEMRAQATAERKAKRNAKRAARGEVTPVSGNAGSSR